LGKNYTTPRCDKQSALCPVSPIQTVKGRVVFLRKVCEKIFTLKPLTVWIFAVAISPPKTLDAAKKPLNLIRLFVQFLIVVPRIFTIAFGRNNGHIAKLHCQSSRLILEPV
jgi:hypothetical protein